MNEEDERLYSEQIAEELDKQDLESTEANDNYGATTNELNYDMWVRKPSGNIDYLNKDVAGAYLDNWEIAHLRVLYVYLKHLKSLKENDIDTDNAQKRIKEKIAQLTVTSTGKEGFLQKIRVTKNIHRTGEYTTIEDKKSPVQFFSRRRGQ